jgi:hypothetical protein
MSETFVLGGPVLHDSPEMRDPTRAACNRPWKPMSPEQLDAYRPQNRVTAAPETPAQEASRIAYETGVTGLGPLVLRIIALESWSRN